MLDVYLLGTGGTVPLLQRWLTSCLIRCGNSAILIDCGEGTQIALQEAGLSCRHIDLILFTHYHADHTAGLPGLLLSMFKADRHEPVVMAGPRGIGDLIDGARKIARFLPFEIKTYEYDEPEASMRFRGLDLTAFKVQHSVPCYGYKIEAQRRPRFDADKARSLSIPLKYWNTLQKGATVIDEDGREYSPDMVLGAPRKGLKVVYVTDTRPTGTIVEMAEHADLLIAEGMYGDPEKTEKALRNQHMTMLEAAGVAQKAEVAELWLTHYSPSMVDPLRYTDEVREVFKNTVIAARNNAKHMNFRN